jgi:hypothetical protein
MVSKFLIAVSLIAPASVPHNDNAIPKLQVCIIPQPSHDGPASDVGDPITTDIA